MTSDARAMSLRGAQRRSNLIIVWMILSASFCTFFGIEWSSPAQAQQRDETLKIDPEKKITKLKKEEMELAEGIIRDFPNNANALVLMGNVLERHGEAVQALDHFKRAIKLDANRPSVYESIGWFYLHKGQYKEAITHWRKALVINSKLPGMHNNIARALMGLGRQTEAIDELEKDIRISPHSATSHFLLGQLYLQRKEYEKAREHYEKTIAINPDHTNTYYGLFTLYTRLKDSAKAREYMTTFRKLKTEDMKVLKDRNNAFEDLIKMQKGAAETFMRAGQIYEIKKDMQRVEKLLNKAVTLDPKNTTCLHRLAYVYVRTNRAIDALQVYKKIGNIDPEDTFGHLNIGLLSARLKRFADAEKAFLRVIDLAPEASNGYRELAQLYLKTRKNIPKARMLAEKAVTLEPIAVNYFVLSWACDLNGDSKSGLKAITRAIELEPGNMRYKKIYEHIKNKK